MRLSFLTESRAEALNLSIADPSTALTRLAETHRLPSTQTAPTGVSCVIPALHPSPRRTGAQAEAFGRFPPRCSGHDGFDNAFPQVIRIGLRHRFGPPESRINAARLAHSHTIGNPESMPQDS